MVRFKNRYLVGELVLPDSSKILAKQKNLRVTGFLLFKAVTHSIEVNFGELVSASQSWNNSLSVRNFDATTQRFLIRCSRKDCKYVQAAVTLVTQLEHRGDAVPCAIDVVHIGGTIKSCEKFLLRDNMDALAQLVQDEEEETATSSDAASIGDKRKLQVFT